jgi:hypothetical protein
MSLGRIGSRAAVVGLGVLASLAVMAAPSWAAKGGNSANAKLCEPGGYPGVLFNQHAETFKNEGKCTSYAAKGGRLVGVDAVAEPAVAGEFAETCSGFGLKPVSPFVNNFGCGAVYEGAIDRTDVSVAADGTASASVTLPCTEQFGNKVSALVVFAETAEGTFFGREFPPPSGC